MKKIIIICIISFTNLYADDFKLEKVIKGFERPWSLTFIDEENLIITEKSGYIKLVNIDKNKIHNIQHNLNVLEDGQGGLLDVLTKMVLFLFLTQKIDKAECQVLQWQKQTLIKKNSNLKIFFVLNHQ